MLLRVSSADCRALLALLITRAIDAMFAVDWCYDIRHDAAPSLFSRFTFIDDYVSSRWATPWYAIIFAAAILLPMSFRAFMLPLSHFDAAIDDADIFADYYYSDAIIDLLRFLYADAAIDATICFRLFSLPMPPFYYYFSFDAFIDMLVYAWCFFMLYCHADAAIMRAAILILMFITLMIFSSLLFDMPLFRLLRFSLSWYAADYFRLFSLMPPFLSFMPLSFIIFNIIAADAIFAAADAIIISLYYFALLIAAIIIIIDITTPLSFTDYYYAITFISTFSLSFISLLRHFSSLLRH